MTHLFPSIIQTRQDKTTLLHFCRIHILTVYLGVVEAISHIRNSLGNLNNIMKKN